MAEHVCPLWIGRLLASPIRRLFQNPEQLLIPFVTPGMTVLEVGPALGFFTQPLARLVGPEGKVVTVDVQESMVRALTKRVAEAGLARQVDVRLCSPTSLEITEYEGRCDFALTFAVVHEAPDAARLMTGIRAAMKPGALCLLAEPSGHVSKEAFSATLRVAADAGLTVADGPRIRLSRSALLRKD
jgi:2-polyprenyl-3-methyl-5-hydroxy-6-metoxy-1,4-benzoquinol methylase